VRIHLGIASLALIMTECYKVSVDIMKNAPLKTIMEDRPISDLLRLNTIGGVSQANKSQIKTRTFSNSSQNTFNF
jgi:hypothetical protein